MYFSLIVCTLKIKIVRHCRTPEIFYSTKEHSILQCVCINVDGVLTQVKHSNKFKGPFCDATLLNNIGIFIKNVNMKI